MNPPVQLRVNSSVNYSVNPECSHHRVILKKLQNFIVPSNFFVVVEETKKRHKQDFGETTTDQDCRETRRYPERFTLAVPKHQQPNIDTQFNMCETCEVDTHEGEDTCNGCGIDVCDNCASRCPLCYGTICEGMYQRFRRDECITSHCHLCESYVCDNCYVFEPQLSEHICKSCRGDRIRARFPAAVRIVVALKGYIKRFIQRYYSPGSLGFVRTMRRLYGNNEKLEQQERTIILAGIKERILTWRGHMLSCILLRKIRAMSKELCQYTYTCGNMASQNIPRFCKKHSNRCVKCKLRSPIRNCALILCRQCKRRKRKSFKSIK